MSKRILSSTNKSLGLVMLLALTSFIAVSARSNTSTSNADDGCDSTEETSTNTSNIFTLTAYAVGIAAFFNILKYITGQDTLYDLLKLLFPGTFGELRIPVAERALDTLRGEVKRARDETAALRAELDRLRTTSTGKISALEARFSSIRNAGASRSLIFRSSTAGGAPGMLSPLVIPGTPGSKATVVGTPGPTPPSAESSGRSDTYGGVDPGGAGAAAPATPERYTTVQVIAGIDTKIFIDLAITTLNQFLKNNSCDEITFSEAEKNEKLLTLLLNLNRMNPTNLSRVIISILRSHLNNSQISTINLNKLIEMSLRPAHFALSSYIRLVTSQSHAVPEAPSLLTPARGRVGAAAEGSVDASLATAES